MAKTCLSQLKDALRTKQFIRFSRRFEDLPICGYALDIGPSFFLVALVSDRLWLDGFECFRLSDVRDVKADPYAHFAESALRKRRERLPKKPHVSVASIEGLLLTAGRAFPLVTIHREQVDPTVCWIGRVLAVERRSVSLLEINPDATWDDKPSTYRLREITRVNFGGDYENALHLVAGDPQETRTVSKNIARSQKRDISKTLEWLVLIRTRLAEHSRSPSNSPRQYRSVFEVQPPLPKLP